MRQLILILLLLFCVADFHDAQVKRRRVSGAVFDPLSISWNGYFRADAVTEDLEGTTAATDDGDPVGRFRDQTANNRHLNATANNTTRPTLKLNIINNQPVVRFDGSNDRLVSVTISNFIANNDYVIYIVLNIASVTTNAANTYQNQAAIADGAAGYFGLHFKSAPSVHLYNYDGTDDNVSSGISTGTWYVMRLRHNGGNLYIKLNDGTEASIASGNTQVLTGLLNMGYAQLSATPYLACDIAELAIKNAQLTGGEETAYRAYLSARYGLTL